MKYKIKYSKAALRDLDCVYEDVLEVSKDIDTSIKYIDDLMNKVEAKTDFPESGSPLYYEDRFTGYYFIVFKAYIIFYHIKENEIFVDRILFGKCDYIRVLHLD